MLSALFIDTDSISLSLAQTETAIDWHVEARAKDELPPNIEAGLSYRDSYSRSARLDWQGIRLIHPDYALVYQLSYAKAKSASKQSTQAVSGFISPASDNLKHYFLSLGIKARWFDRVGHYYSVSLGWQQSEIDLFNNATAQVRGSHWVDGPIFRQAFAYGDKQQGVVLQGSSEHKFEFGNLGLALSLTKLEADTRFAFHIVSSTEQQAEFYQTADSYRLGVELEYSYPLSAQTQLYATYRYSKAAFNSGSGQAEVLGREYFLADIKRYEVEISGVNLGLRWLF